MRYLFWIQIRIHVILSTFLLLSGGKKTFKIGDVLTLVPGMGVPQIGNDLLRNLYILQIIIVFT